jgi:hypothetical protein
MLMNPQLVPDWIKHLKAEEAGKRSQTDSEAAKQLCAATTITAQGPEFWRQLFRELALNTDSLPELGLQGSATIQDTSTSEMCYRIEVSLRAAWPKMTYTNLFYVQGAQVIRGHTFEDTTFKLQFALGTDGSFGVILENPMAPTNPEQTAQWIVERMVQLIKRQ